jgi:hypothetical protein
VDIIQQIDQAGHQEKPSGLVLDKVESERLYRMIHRKRTPVKIKGQLYDSWGAGVEKAHEL